MEPVTTPPDIAVIGIACRLPGGASSPDKFWEFLSQGRSAYSEVPPNRYNVDSFHHPADEKVNTTRPRGGHFLHGDVAGFDAPFFSISAQEAKAMDPMQRVLLETTYEALENAGLPIESLTGSNTSCYVGAFTRDYHEMLTRDAETAPIYMITGTGFSLLANRISWFYDFRGPSMTLDTACSSSLVALHLACQSLRNGESKLAVVSGANLIISPDTTMWLSNMRMVSKDGISKSFDDDANGYGRGEGFVTVILKPLKTALENGDMIRAIIRGTGVNQDGHTVGITQPNSRAQADLIESTYRSAGLDFGETGYFEAHGTGTKVGDPLEMQAISHTLCAGREQGNEIFVGSVKSNIGHLEGAAGLAGLLKTILMIERGVIPPSIHFHKPNRRIPLDTWRIKIPTAVTNWPTKSLRRASVNSFGYGGTNAHAILDDVYHFLASRGLQGNHNSRFPVISNGVATHQSQVRNRMFVFSARSEDALKQMRRDYHDWLQSLASDHALSTDLEDSFLDRLSFTLNERRSRLEWKAAIVAASVRELKETLIEPTFESKRSSIQPRIGFVFTGQGAQWARMGRELSQYPVFDASLADAESYLKESLGCEWSVSEELGRDEHDSRIHLAMFSQPLCTILQVAMVDLLKAWNILPHAVVGHSSGEIAAAYCCGAITRVDAWKIAYYRGKLSSGLKTQAPKLKGGMIAVGLSSDEATRYLQTIETGTLVVACVNSPSSVTVSGDMAAIDELQDILKKNSVFCHRLKVENAYHSPQMEVIADEYRQLILSVTPQKPESESMVMISSVTEVPVAYSDLGPDYWVRNLVSPVLFSGAFQSLFNQNSKRRRRTANPSLDILLEVGPHSALKGPLRQIMQQQEMRNVSYASVLVRGEDATRSAAKAAGFLHISGTPVNISSVNATASPTKLLVDLPSYPWNHSLRYWSESRLSKGYRFRKHTRHDLLGVPVSDYNEQEPRWRNFLRVSDLPWIRDHVVHSSMLYPGAGVITMAVEAIQQITGDDSDAKLKNVRLRDVRVEKAILVPDDQAGVECILQLRRQRTGRTAVSTWWEFSVFTCQEGESLEENATGLVTVERETGLTIEPKGLAAQRLEESYHQSKRLCTQRIEPDDFYTAARAAGLHYGPTFQNLVEIHAGPSQSTCVISIPNIKRVMPGGVESSSLIHPTTLDTVIHSLFAALGNGELDLQNAAVPVAFDSLVISADIPSGESAQLSGFCQAARGESGDIMANICMSDLAWGEPKLQIVGMRCKELPSLGSSKSSQGQATKSPFGTLVWKPDITLLDGEGLVRYLGQSQAVSGTENTVDIPSTHTESLDERRIESIKAWESSIVQFLDLAARKNPNLSILQIGIGSGSLISSILSLLGPEPTGPARFTQYSLADSDRGSLTAMEKRFHEWKHRMTFSVFNIQEDVSPELQETSFDVVIVTPGIEDTETRQLLDWGFTLTKPRGNVLAVEVAPETNGRTSSLTDGFKANSTLTKPYCTSLSKSVSFADGVYRSSLQVYTIADDKQPEYPTTIYILQPSTISDKVSRLTGEIQSSLDRKGIQTEAVLWSARLSQLNGKPVISLLELEEPILPTIHREGFEALRTMILGAASLLWITMGDSPLMATAIGFLRSIQNENPHLDLCHLHLEDSVPSGKSSRADTICSIALEHGAEREYTEMNGVININQWVVLEGMNRLRLDAKEDETACEYVPLGQVQRGLKLVSGDRQRPEAFHFTLDDRASIDLAPDEVEIAVHAVGLSPRNIVEASGIVTRVGMKCSGLQPGDRVWAVGRDAWGSVFRTNEFLCQILPRQISFRQAASWFFPFALAHYSLNNKARLQPGQTVLIQGAACSVGRAAIQIARNCKAIIFATARSEQERVQIEDLGISSHHIFRDDNSELAAEIGAASADKGPDVIVSTSLSGEGLRQVWNCIAPSGVFLDLSGDDLAKDSSLDMAPFLRGASFTHIATDTAMEEISSLTETVVTDVISFVDGCAIDPTEASSVFPVSQMAEAVRRVHHEPTEKVIVMFSAGDVVPVSLSAINPLSLDTTGTYVLAGGLGGLGKSLAKLLVAHGAHFLVFLSRSGPSTDKAQALIQELTELGVTVKVYACDVSSLEAMRHVINQCSTELPPIKGVIQGAMVLNDAIYETMTHDQWEGTIRPKVQGSWNLHQLLPRDMDFFIMLSSISGVVGNPGQANYAAGNTFQDQLSVHRRNCGLPAISLDLGLMLGIGVVAEKGGHQSLQKWGSVGINEQEFHALMKVAMAGYLGLQACPSQLIIGLPTGGLVKQHDLETPSYFSNPRFSLLKSMGLEHNQDDKDRLFVEKVNPLPRQISSAKSIQEASTLISQALCLKVAKTLQTPVENIDANKPLRTYGVDSLSATEVRNWVVGEIQSNVSLFDVLSGMSIMTLAGKIAASSKRLPSDGK